MKIRIDKGKVEDMEMILDLVRELAAYVSTTDQVVATLEEYQKLFNDHLFDVLVAKNDRDEIVGMMLYYFVFSTWKGKMLYLEDFVVKEEVRHLGIGQKLFAHLLTLAKDENCKLVKWQVVEGNTNAIKFYQKQDAIMEKKWWTCKIDFKQNISI